MLGPDACEFGGQLLELLWLALCYRGERGVVAGAPLPRATGGGGLRDAARGLQHVRGLRSGCGVTDVFAERRRHHKPSHMRSL